jgi:hypothetical protein
MSYSKELKETVKELSNIKEVHFTASGEHFLNVFPMGSDKFGIFINGFPILTSKIVSTVMREEILGKKEDFQELYVSDLEKENILKEKFKKNKK